MKICMAGALGRMGLRILELGAGADDIITNDDKSIDVLTTMEEFSAVRDALVAKGLEAEEAEITMRPSTSVDLELSDAESMVRLLETLDDLDDVQEVHSNADISEDVLEQLG